MIDGRRVLVGVSGGIASYKTCILVRRLAELGAEVHVILTASAAEFVRPVTFEALSGRPVLTSLWTPGGSLSHITLARDADLVVLAPATANLLARAAQGVADDLLTTILLATRSPILAAPAMNDRMFDHPATAKNLETLRERGWKILGPAVGDLAEGPSTRPGRMVEPEEIVAYAVRLLRGSRSALQGKRVLVTAGPTRERIDPVRVITNPSSGRMGFAVAEAAFARGAHVVLATGPTTLTPPFGVEVVRVETTEHLLAAVRERLGHTDALIMAAAPADYRARVPATGKVPRSEGPLEIRLEPTTDVLEATVGERAPGMRVVGFALETEPGLDRAREKLERKRLDMIVLNVADEAGAGFEVETNRVTLVGRDWTRELPLLTKKEVAEHLLDQLETML